jgi:filamentous hemagglutinin family protein
MFRRLVTVVLTLGIVLNAPANPTGMTVRSGSATATTTGSQLTITTGSQNTLLNWQSFNIAAVDTTTFQEPSTTSIVWNQINNANPSQIYGSLQANGIVVLVNSSGFYFGPNSFVKAAGLVVSTANCMPPQNSGGGWEFNGPPPLASIVNYGQIKVGNGGSAFLLADKIENHGDIEAPGGSVGLAAGQTVLLSERPDGRGMSMQVTLPSGSVDNEGRLVADGGTIAMHAQVVNQNGFIQANSVRNQNGVIELVASDQLTLGANSQITASGDNSPAGSAGGTVTLQSGNNFSDSVGSQIITTGGTQGGNGGNVEISAPNVQSLNSSINARAQAGWTSGKLLLDPDHIILDTSGSGSAGSGTVLAGDNPGSTLDLNVNTAFANLAVSQIILQAVYDITLIGGTSWNLSGTIGAGLGGVTSGQLTLEAGRNIIFGNGSKITDANSWLVTLEAGVSFPSGVIQSGSGSVYLAGGKINSVTQTSGGSIQTASGSINLEAGNNIQIGSGTVSSSAGDVNWQAGGNIQFGNGSKISDGSGAITLDAGYNFANNTIKSGSGNIYLNGGNNGTGSGYIQTDSGSISLVAGSGIQIGSGTVSSSAGDVTWQAGGNIQFGDGSKITDGSGAVTLDAGYNFTTKAVVSTAGTSSSATAGNIFLDGGPAGDGVGGSIQTASGSINLQAGNGIQIGSGAVSSSGGDVKWQASGDIVFGDGSQITDGSGAVTLDAGFNFANQTVKSGSGNIYLNGGLDGDGLGGSIRTAGGDINLQAGQDITVGSGYVITTGGGSISAHALAGNIDTGSDAQGYYFSISSVSSLSQAYNLNDGLGGISTAAGGDVTLIAGGDVTSVLPGNGIYYYDGNQVSPNNADYTTAGSGAYGSQHGDVTIVAGGNVTGHYLVANGTGAIYAGVKMVNGIPVDANNNPVTDGKSYILNSVTGSAGTADNELALSLITGGWTVDAAHDIYLQEVRNPNGVFDINGGRNNVHYFNYAASDYVDLNAGNLVQLGASPSVLPRPTGIKVPFIYPSILNVTAGAGGVQLTGDTAPFNQLILFPSPQGSLTINATDGGSLVGSLKSSGTAPQIFNLIVSDSGLSQYTASGNFGINDHASSPIHAATSTDPNNSTPIALNISGNMSLVLLGAPEAAQINVVGNMYNSRFQGMNLYANDATSINVGQTAKENMEKSGLLNPNTDSSIKVGGDIINRGDFTSVTLDLNQIGVQAPDMADLSLAVNNNIGSTSISEATLLSSLYYNTDTHVLTYQNISGVKFTDVLNLLQNLTVQKVDTKGNLLWLDPLNTIPDTKQVSILGDPTIPGTVAYALLAQYNADNAFSGIQAGSGPPDGTYGYTIGGGGKFNITARTIDLGTTAGIQSEGVGLYTVNGNYPLKSLFGNGGVFDHGADITITTTGNHLAGETAGALVGDLDMYSSSIASLQGGDITIYAGGDVNAGSADFSVNTTSVRGIYSTDQGNVYVYANGNINVNGSRIAVYDTRQNSDNSSATPGGSVTVVSRNGSIDAGNGGSGFVVVSSYLVNPDQSVIAYSPTIPGSGIMEVSYTKNGNILVEAPHGGVNAGAGGILQLLLNGPPLPDSTTLFGLPLNGLAEMFDLALNGKMKAALKLQNSLNGNPGNSAVDVFAGYELQKLDGSGNPIVDAYGDPGITALNLSDGTLVKISDNQNITATGSGVIGAGAVTLNASGNITGNIFTLGNVNIIAVNNVDVTALAGGTANVSGSSLSGTTIIGIGGINASGDTSGASLLSNNQISGGTSGSQGLAPGTAANAASQGMASDNSASPAKNADTTATDDDEKKKKGKTAATVQKKGRVTVLLPPKHLSQNQTSNNHL